MPPRDGLDSGGANRKNFGTSSVQLRGEKEWDSNPRTTAQHRTVVGALDKTPRGGISRCNAEGVSPRVTRQFRADGKAYAVVVPVRGANPGGRGASHPGLLHENGGPPFHVCARLSQA